jgi:hypothetical protein
MGLESAIQEKATIAADASLSGAVHLNGRLPGGIRMPTAWNTAALTFQRSVDGANYSNVYDASGNEYTVQTSASCTPTLDPLYFWGANYIKVRSGTSGSAVNQTAARDLYIELRTP